MENLRNFSIIAHVDHGKSTLADRLIERCNGVAVEAQALDTMDIERERGITIKSQAVALDYQAADGARYALNLIDTPGHVDFGYEVSRSLAACEGALLLIDATQGVEAQSIANCHAAIDQGVEVLPVLNKTDLPSADCDRARREIEDIIGIDASDALEVSAKTGAGVEALLERVVARVPPPAGDLEAPTRALVIDSWFDQFAGVVALARVVDGRLQAGRPWAAAASGAGGQLDALGVLRPAREERQELRAGEVGIVHTGVKHIQAVRVGDTLIDPANPAAALPGFKALPARVFAGVFPTDASDYPALSAALDKLRLNDAALACEKETSTALGFGFRCGFLGMLHMEVVCERLRREYGIDLFTTAPTVTFEVVNVAGEVVPISNPCDLPPAGEISVVREPLIRASILAPKDYVGDIFKLCLDRRGAHRKLQYSARQALLEFDLPLHEVVFDFFDALKSATRGYASFDCELAGFQEAPMTRLDILVNGERVDALASIVHRDRAEAAGRAVTEKLKELIPRQMFEVALQAAVGSRIIARSTIKAARKNVTAKCYGGDVTRKRKLLEKQKAGKKRMKRFGKVEVPQEAFLAVLKADR